MTSRCMPHPSIGGERAAARPEVASLPTTPLPVSRPGFFCENRDSGAVGCFHLLRRFGQPPVALYILCDRVPLTFFLPQDLDGATKELAAGFPPGLAIFLHNPE